MVRRILGRLGQELIPRIDIRAMGAGVEKIGVVTDRHLADLYLGRVSRNLKMAGYTVVPIVLAPMGLLVFWGYCFATTGDAFAGPSSMYHGWGWYFSPPWEALTAMLRSDNVAFFFGLVSLGLLVCSLLLWRQGWYEEFAFCVALIVLMMSGAVIGSLFRYGLVLFPLWIALARALAPRPVLSALTFSTLALLNAMMMSAWTLQNLIAI